jgi:hypothetical protein
MAPVRPCLVDSQPRTGNNQLPSQLPPHVVIDHHPLRKATLGCPFIDVRRDYGATATILTEYLLASGHQPTRRQATALVYALQAETQDFGRESTGPDHAVHDLLLPRVDKRAGPDPARRLPLALPQSAPLPRPRVRRRWWSPPRPVDQPDIVPRSPTCCSGSKARRSLHRRTGPDLPLIRTQPRAGRQPHAPLLGARQGGGL